MSCSPTDFSLFSFPNSSLPHHFVRISPTATEQVSASTRSSSRTSHISTPVTDDQHGPDGSETADQLNSDRNVEQKEEEITKQEDEESSLTRIGRQYTVVTPPAQSKLPHSTNADDNNESEVGTSAKKDDHDRGENRGRHPSSGQCNTSEFTTRSWAEVIAAAAIKSDAALPAVKCHISESPPANKNIGAVDSHTSVSAASYTASHPEQFTPRVSGTATPPTDHPILLCLPPTMALQNNCEAKDNTVLQRFFLTLWRSTVLLFSVSFSAIIITLWVAGCTVDFRRLANIINADSIFCFAPVITHYAAVNDFNRKSVAAQSRPNDNDPRHDCMTDMSQQSYCSSYTDNNAVLVSAAGEGYGFEFNQWTFTYWNISSIVHQPPSPALNTLLRQRPTKPLHFIELCLSHPVDPSVVHMRSPQYLWKHSFVSPALWQYYWLQLYPIVPLHHFSSLVVYLSEFAVVLSAEHAGERKRRRETKIEATHPHKERPNRIDEVPNKEQRNREQIAAGVLTQSQTLLQELSASSPFKTLQDRIAAVNTSGINAPKAQNLSFTNNFMIAVFVLVIICLMIYNCRAESVNRIQRKIRFPSTTPSEARRCPSKISHCRDEKKKCFDDNLPHCAERDLRQPEQSHKKRTKSSNAPPVLPAEKTIAPKKSAAKSKTKTTKH